MDQILREHAGQGRTPLTQSLVPPPPFNGAAARSTALEGTLAYRVELLEEGLDLLLRAQELSWQEKKAAAAASGGAAAAQEASNSDNSRGCCCTVM